MRMAVLLAACLANCCLVNQATASQTTVPDQFSTIQAAIEANVDTVFVRAGTYPESLLVHSRPYESMLALVAVPPDAPFEGPGASRVLGLRVDCPIAGLTMRGFTFSGPVVVGPVVGSISSLQIDGCWFGGGLSGGPAQYAANWLRLWNNVIFGDLSLSVQDFDIAMNTVFGGIIYDWHYGGPAYIHDNVVLGPAPVGIIIGENVFADHNYVRNCVDGIRTSQGGNNAATNNTVLDCSGTGIITDGHASTISGNRILRCGADGIRAVGANVVDNVVGRCGGHGIASVCSQQGVPPCYLGVRNNTVYLNAGAGIDLSVATGDQGDYDIDHNISCGNAVGLHATGSSATLGCNDWFGNPGGTTIGLAEGASDTTLNPLFCDLAADDVYLSSSSPLLSLGACGRIGALGAGCSVALGVEPTQRDENLTLSVRPLPARQHVEFAFGRPLGAESELLIYDVTGALVWSQRIAAGTSLARWDGADRGGGTAPPGMYLARLRTPNGERTGRVILIR